MKGHPAKKCYRRGFAFLPQDLQRQITAYNAKYGDSPDNDKSTDTDNKILQAPTAKLNHSQSNDTTKHSTTSAVINKISHFIAPTDTPDESHLSHQADIEFYYFFTK